MIWLRQPAQGLPIFRRDTLLVLGSRVRLLWLSLERVLFRCAAGARFARKPKG